MPAAATTSRFGTAFQLLTIGRWDYAFDVAWNATKAAKTAIGDLNQIEALRVRNSGNRALSREFCGKMSDRLTTLKRPGLAIAWAMLAADPDKPESILHFVPQLAFAFGADAEGVLSAADYAFARQSLDRWMDGAEGEFRGAKSSMFTLQFQGSPAERKAAFDAATQTHKSLMASMPGLSNFDVAKIPPPDAEPDEPPGITVMTILTATKLTSDQAAYKALFDKHLPFSMCTDLLRARQKLLSQYPHAADAIDLLLRDLREGKPARIAPVLLVGPPGAGKSRLVRFFTSACGLETYRFDASGIIDSLSWSGSSKAWSNTQACVPVRAIMATQRPNPLILIDEIDKASSATHGANGNLMSSLLPYLERETSARHRDTSLDCEVRLDWVSYCATANDDSALPAFIKDRFRVIRIPAPKLEHLAALAYNVQADMAAEAGDPVDWIEPLADDELEVAGKAWAKAKFSLRALQRIVKATVETRAAFPGMRH